jgi:predicted RNA-binding Zn ribbon-like protein
MRFLFVGERLAIDLLNTVVSERGQPRDLILDRARLTAWAEAAGLGSMRDLASERRSPPEPAAIRCFREALRLGLVAWARRGRAPPALIQLLNQQLARDAQRPALVAQRGRARLAARSTAGPLDRLYAALARSAAELLVNSEPRRLRKCANPGCLLMFYDVSRGGRRRWCSMRSCGTRAKVRAYYWRRRSGRRGSGPRQE